MSPGIYVLPSVCLLICTNLNLLLTGGGGDSEVRQTPHRYKGSTRLASLACVLVMLSG